MNRYTDCGGFILSANGKQWPVETAHPLPLPEGIDENAYLPNGCIQAVQFGPYSSERQWTGLRVSGVTHWLAPRPLPPVPKVKTQEELDEEAYQNWLTEVDLPRTVICGCAKAGFKAGAAYSRKGAK